MEAAGETCKLCLKYIQGAHMAVLDETLLGKLEFLQMDLDQSVEESNSVCKECEEKIENAFDFKSCLVNTESCLVPYVSEDKTQKVNLRVIVEKDSPSTSAGESSAEKEVCRLCKNFVDATAVISLPKILKDDSMMEVFQGHIPEMDLEVTENPVVCVSCQNSLSSFSTLITSWSIANGWNEDDDDDMKEDYDELMGQVKKESDELSDSNTNSSIGILDISDSAKKPRTAKSKNGQVDVKVKSETDEFSDSSASVSVKSKDVKKEDGEGDTEMEDLQLKNEEVDIKDEDGKRCTSNTASLGDSNLKQKQQLINESGVHEQRKVENFHCMRCPYKCKNQSTMKKHMLDHNSIDQASLFRCQQLNVESQNLTVQNCSDIVDYLLDNLFSRLKDEDKAYVINITPPKPDLSITLIIKGKQQNRAFSRSLYNKYNWLVGSTLKNKLFCWPCLLLSNDRDNIWCKLGHNGVKHVSRSLQRHAKSKEHISSNCKFINFLDSASLKDIANYNKQVQVNREILKKIIDICLFLSNLEFEFNTEHFEELVAFIIKGDETGVNIFNSRTTQNDLMECITAVVCTKIEKDILEANFISWQIDELEDICCNSQLSVIFRFVKEDKIVERFLGFLDVGRGRTSDHVFSLLVAKFQKFDLYKKLVAQTYDGADVMTGLEDKIKTIAPHALFTHCHDHSLDVVLTKACSSIKEVRIFFACLSGFSSFFSTATKRTILLDKFCDNHLANTAPTCWNFTSRPVSTVMSNKHKLINFFEHIIDSENFDSTSTREAFGLKHCLLDSKFLFFLETFHLIFEHTHVIFSVLKNKFTIYSKSRLYNLLTKINDFKNDEKYFNTIFDKVLCGNDLNEPKVKRFKHNDTRQEFRQVFLEILNTVVYQIEIRLVDIQKLSFFELLNVESFEKYSKEFPEDYMNNFIPNFNLFDRELLKNELKVLYSDNILGTTKTPYEMLKYIYENDLVACLPELLKLIKLILTFPFTSVIVEEKFSALKKIKTYVGNSVRKERISNVAILSIEKEFIQNLCRNADFYNEVIDYFAETKGHRIPLIYKKF